MRYFQSTETRDIQNVAGKMCQTPGEFSLLTIHRYKETQLYPKLNGNGNNGERKVWSSCGSVYCTWFA